MAYKIAPEEEQLSYPPIGMQFDNNGPYIGTRGVEHDPRLRNALNLWTGPRGYAVMIARTRKDLPRCQIFVNCVLNGEAKYRSERANKAPNEYADDFDQRVREAKATGQKRPKRPLVSRKTGCPFSFIIEEDTSIPGKYT